MKKLFCFLLAICVMMGVAGCVASNMETETQAENTEALSNDWATAYREYLNDYLTENENGYLPYERFSLQYIDNDDVPELLLSTGFSHPSVVDILSFVDGEVKVVKELGEWGTICIQEKTGTVVELFQGMGYSSVVVSELKNGELTKVWKGTEEAVNSPDDYSSILSNDEDVTEEELQKLYKEYVPDHLTVVGPDLTGLFWANDTQFENGNTVDMIDYTQENLDEVLVSQN